MTGLFRARDRLHVFADDSALVKIAAIPLPHRNSGLLERVVHETPIDEDELSDDDDWAENGSDDVFSALEHN
ncbi:MAG: hypothetical protein K9J77_12350 [Rhodoferax sp.]|nr:hypothetical protein [Rhodoferax sp.]